MVIEDSNPSASVVKPLVRFYVYRREVSEQERLDFVCFLTEKAQLSDKRVAILCADKMQAELLNERLWSFKPESFIPHCYSGDEYQSKATAILSVVPERLMSADVAINLSLEHYIDMPKGSDRVFEVVNQTPEVLNATRIRFQRYRQVGFVPKTFKL